MSAHRFLIPAFAGPGTVSRLDADLLLLAAFLSGVAATLLASITPDMVAAVRLFRACAKTRDRRRAVRLFLMGEASRRRTSLRRLRTEHLRARIHTANKRRRRGPSISGRP